ncbi:MAG: DivIVA domain-containing protein [Streptococcaceae bacterium]|jgi:DivIVA domain-containing protein|nr:DivIVA domain-containing protein [Streptococcaceae bacterium]
MANYKYTPRDIYETDFETKMRGYDKDQVDEMLDNVIVDYETYASEILKLQEENEFLKNRVAELERGGGSNDLDQTQRLDAFIANSGTTSMLSNNATGTAPQVKEPSNYELIKRINRLERAVFGADSQYNANS